MKISNSKKELARIISENGGWKDQKAEWSAQDGSDGQVSFFKIKAPTYSKPEKEWMAFGDSVHCYHSRIECCKVIKNFHQTILSREEYFFLHQNQGLEDALDEPMVESKPTIEQLAADYRTAKDHADRKQQEADASKADADEKLRVLEIAGEALGLLVSPITAKQDAELVITDWRDLRVGDEVDAKYRGIERVVGSVIKIDVSDSNQPIFVSDGVKSIWATEFKLIRRP